jgi:hypothetical protein
VKTIHTWLVIRNGDDLRLAKRRPQLAVNEVAVEIIVTCPTPPRIVGTVNVELPEPPPALATAVAIEYPTEDVEEAHRLSLAKALAAGGNGE